jgi:hypothetical protein
LKLNIRRLALWLAVLVGLQVLAVAAIETLEYRAEMKARAICERFPLGSSMQDVAKAAAAEGDPQFRIIRSDHIGVTYTGVTRSSRHACLVDGENGKVTQAQYGYMD